MSKSTLLILGGGLLFAVLAAVLVQMMLGGNKKQQAAQAAKTVQILVASKDIKMGDVFGTTNVKWQTWPEATVLPTAIRREGEAKAEEALKGKSRRDVQSGEPLSKAMLVDDTGTSFIAAALDPGKRAVSIRVTAQSGLSGLVGPGDRVDVLLTGDVRLPSDEKLKESSLGVVNRLESQTLIENVRVLAVDQATTRPSDPKVVKTVTVEVTPKDAERLVLGSKMGELTLSLRGAEPADAKKTEVAMTDTSVTTTDVRVSRVMQELLGGQTSGNGLQTRTVRVYNGRNVQNMEVRP